jgi:acetylornithine/succinyldiaminopimelate/putrescine aminotransferase
MMNADTTATAIMNQLSERTEENFQLFSDYVNPYFVKLLGLVGFGRRFVSSSGFELIDDAGGHYLDFLSGYGSLNVGHNHPKVRKALQVVLTRDIPGFTQVDCGLMTGLAAEKLAGLLPDGLDKVYFCNSGSEAVDAAVKLARAATRRKRIICCDGAFHGNTLSVLGMTDNPSRKDRFRPLIPGIVRVPFDNRDALAHELRWKDVAAFVIEPVLGEGGALVPHPGYFPDALELCHQHGTLLIVDEVQTGLGRTGKMFAFEHFGIAPDAVCLAKSLSGGYIPVGAMATRGDLFERAYGSLRSCMDHKNTFGGGPLAMTAVLATIGIVQEEELIQNAEIQGGYLKQELDKISQKHHQIKELRGIGLMLGLKFAGVSVPGLESVVPNTIEKASAELFTQHVALQLLKTHRIITQVAANDFSVLKVMPPLTITRAAIGHFVESLDAILSDSGYARALLSMARELWSNR